MGTRPIPRQALNSTTWVHIEADDPVTGELRVHGEQILNSSRRRLVTTYYEQDVTGPIGHHVTDLRIDPDAGLWDPVTPTAPPPPLPPSTSVPSPPVRRRWAHLLAMPARLFKGGY